MFLADLLLAGTFVAALVFAYFVPAIVAIHRKHNNAVSIFLVNLLLGWTFIGWIGALVWAFTAQPSQKPS